MPRTTLSVLCWYGRVAGRILLFQFYVGAEEWQAAYYSFAYLLRKEATFPTGTLLSEH